MSSPKIELLMSAMHQTDFSLAYRSQVHSDILIINQCDQNAYQEVKVDGNTWRMISCTERGSAKSRNMALRNSNGELCLFCDDDEKLSENYCDLIQKAYSELHKPAAIVFNVDRINNSMKKTYYRINKVRKAPIWRGYQTPMLMIDREQIIKADIHFNENFGAGAKWGPGEDPLFEYDMNRRSYLEKMADAAWAPGWEAITDAFSQVYEKSGDYLPIRQFSDFHSSLEGFGVYPSPKNYLHIVTRGLSRIYPHPEAYGCRTSGWGFELTIKWQCDSQDSEDAFRLLDRLAELVEIQKNGFSPMKRLWRGRDPLTEDAFSKYGAGLVTLPDTELKTIDTVHGRVAFLQVVNISAGDAKQLSVVPALIYRLIERMQNEDGSIPFHLPSPHNYLTT